ncbi:MAG: hypothetical protein RR620_08535 [Clostridium sp.]
MKLFLKTKKETLKEISSLKEDVDLNKLAIKKLNCIFIAASNLFVFEMFTFKIDFKLIFFYSIVGITSYLISNKLNKNYIKLMKDRDKDLLE